MPAFYLAIELLGTFSFALSGVRLASAKHFDIFGAFIVGMATAVGGGTLRDLMLGLRPFWMTDSIYLVVCALGVLWVMMFRKRLVRQDNAWFLFDTIGLALFNVIGIEKTLGIGLPYWTAIAMGCVTGAAGGIIRDVLINEVPLIFRKEIYAVACVAGGLVYTACHSLHVSAGISAPAAILTVICIRLLAVRYHWHLPVLRGEEQS